MSRYADPSVYAQELIEKGVDVHTAHEIARKTILSGVSPQSQGGAPAHVSERAGDLNAEGSPPSEADPIRLLHDGFELTPPPGSVREANNYSRSPKKSRDPQKGNNQLQSGKASGKSRKIRPLGYGKSPESLTRNDKKLIEAAMQIQSHPPQGDEISFNYGILSQLGLPRSKTDTNTFLRRFGETWVQVQGGQFDQSGPCEQYPPYGAMARLILNWISTYAIRHQTREVYVGSSPSDLLKRMGIENLNGPYRDSVREQMFALATFRFQVNFYNAIHNVQPVEFYSAWFGEHNPREIEIQSQHILLSESFYRLLVEHPVPVDLRALKALRKSALAMDVYSWLAYRLPRIPSKQPLRLHWKPIREQFGQEYQGEESDKDFKKKFLPALQKVLMVYPQARVEQMDGGLLLYTSAPPVEHKKPRALRLVG